MRACRWTQPEQPAQPTQRGAPEPSKQAGPELKNTEKPKAPPPESKQDEEKKGAKRIDAQEKAMYSTNRWSPPLQITPTAVADQSSTHASCMA